MINLRQGPCPLTAWRLWVDRQSRMRGSGLWRWQPLLFLLPLLYISGSQEVDIAEEQECLMEGGNLTVLCPYNIGKYGSSLKAWQRVRSQGPPETLARTTTKNLAAESIRSGRILLENLPTDGVMKVTMTGLRREDAGLYQCVIDLSPQAPFILHDRIRLVHCNGLSGTSSQDPTEKTILPLTRPTSPKRTHPTSTVSSPGFRVNSTKVADVIRVSVFSIVVPVACGILSKALVFTVLLIVTQRSAH
ncbi:triggering receptor expressed on myeloid cells 1 [Tenrec ecaudatus]|uniref:triggering receptor expressed on myeloid cells 1 n=1 Tax=Tenrec ecaudatus TaxID=94439 RepID=UPI003F59C569